MVKYWVEYATWYPMSHLHASPIRCRWIERRINDSHQQARKFVFILNQLLILSSASQYSFTGSEYRNASFNHIKYDGKLYYDIRNSLLYHMNSAMSRFQCCRCAMLAFKIKQEPSLGQWNDSIVAMNLWKPIKSSVDFNTLIIQKKVQEISNHLPSTK